VCVDIRYFGGFCGISNSLARGLGRRDFVQAEIKTKTQCGFEFVSEHYW
jgi:hypothetical protein